MPKQFAFHQLWRQACAIDFQVGRIAPRTQLMNQPSEVIFTSPAFSGDQKSGGRSGHFFGKFQQAQRRRVFRNPRQSLGGHVPERRSCPRLDRRSSEEASLGKAEPPASSAAANPSTASGISSLGDARNSRSRS